MLFGVLGHFLYIIIVVNCHFIFHNYLLYYLCFNLLDCVIIDCDVIDCVIKESYVIRLINNYGI